MMFWVKFDMNLSAFLCLEMIGQLSESNLGIGKLKLGFLGEKCLIAEATLFFSPSASNLPRLASCSCNTPFFPT